jgi:hypothetical protein
MLNVQLLPRPFSYDRPRVEGYAPMIRARITRVSRSRRNAWCSEILVDACPMAISHHHTKSEAETHAEGMLKAYAEVHYVQV